MEDVIKKQAYIPHSRPPSSPLAMHRNSHTISKAKPKIRIIHIFAPEIIKTDVENFRELVQRLTGKPTDHHRHHHQKSYRKITNNPRNPRREEEPRSASAAAAASVGQPVLMNKKVHQELRSSAAAAAAFLGLESCRTEKVNVKGEEKEEEEEEEIMKWNNNNNNNNNTGANCNYNYNYNSGVGFLNGFADFDGFIQELGEFPLLPMDASHHMHAFEGTQLA